MEFFPKELVSEILLRLPAISLIQFKCVCKSWFSTINSLSAQNLLRNDTNNNTTNIYLLLDVSPDHKTTRTLSYHTLKAVRTSYPPLDPKFGQKIKITCYCNGLVLFSDQFKTKWGLWNLATGQTHLLPSSPSQRLDKQYYGQRNLLFQNVGFGFDTKTMDYKVVTIYKFLDDLPGSLVVEIYSLKTNSWTSIPTFLDDTRIGLPSEEFYQIHGRHGVFSNGMLSWRASDAIYTNDMGYGEVWQGIISVDLSNENIITTGLPSIISHSMYSLVNSMVYKESFSLAAYNCHRHSYHIWVLDEYGLKESWKMLVTIGPLYYIGRVLGFWKDDKVLFEKFTDAPYFRDKNPEYVPAHKPYEKELFLLDTATRKLTSLEISFVDKVFNY